MEGLPRPAGGQCPASAQAKHTTAQGEAPSAISLGNPRLTARRGSARHLASLRFASLRERVSSAVTRPLASLLPARPRCRFARKSARSRGQIGPAGARRAHTTMTESETASLSTDCPPSEAVAAEGEVYRCCKSRPPSSRDLQTHEELGRLPKADACLRRSLSVFRNETDARHQVRLFPGWRKRFVARGVLKASHGHVMMTSGRQPTHTSWWPAASLVPAGRAALFEVVCEVGR